MLLTVTLQTIMLANTNSIKHFAIIVSCLSWGHHYIIKHSSLWNKYLIEIVASYLVMAYTFNSMFFSLDKIE